MKAAVEHMHAWVMSIAEAVNEHASAIDAASVEPGATKAQLAAVERELGEGLSNAENNLTQIFVCLNSLVGQLRSDTTATAAAIAARAEPLEQRMPALQEAFHLGLGGQTTGRGRGGPDIAAALSAVV